MSKTSGVLKLMGAKGGLLAIQIFSVPLYYRVLGATDYGVILYIEALRIWLETLDLNTGSGALQRISSAFGRGDDERAWLLHRSALFIFLIAGFVGLVIFTLVGTQLTIPNFSGSREVTIMLFAFAGSRSLFEFVRRGIETTLIAKERFGNVALVSSVIPTSCTLFNIALVWTFQTNIALSAGMALEGLLSLTATLWLVKKREKTFPLKPAFNIPCIQEILSLSLKSFVGNTMTRIGQTADKLIIANVLGPQAVAFYSTATRIPQVFNDLLIRTHDAILPELVRAGSEGAAKLARVCERNHRIICTAGVSSILILCAASTPALKIWLPRQDIPFGGQVAFLMGIYYSVELLYGNFTKAALAVRMQHYIIPFSAFNALMTCANTAWVSRAGNLGAVALMNVVIGTVQFVPMVFYLRRYVIKELDVKLVLLTTMKVYGVGLVFGGGLYMALSQPWAITWKWLSIWTAPAVSLIVLTILLRSRFGLAPTWLLNRFPRFAKIVAPAN